LREPIDRVEGRRLFGADPGTYDRIRPDYPSWIFTDLTTSGALFRGAATLEIGAGSGLATRPLLAAGANPLTLLEPDARFAGALSRICESAEGQCVIRQESFEAASLAPGSFDLIIAATAFHWLEPATAFARSRALLKPGGTLALLWNVLQVLGRPDPFHEATAALLAPLATSPSGAPDTLPFPLDREARIAEATAAGFRHAAYRESYGSMTLTADEVCQLYGTFSSVRRLPPPEREALLTELRALAADQFGGRVVRNVTSCLYRFS